MRVQVEIQVEQGGAETLRRLRFDGRLVDLTDQIDQWHGADHWYVKVRSREGDIYILRHDDGRDEWELTMFQRHSAR